MPCPTQKANDDQGSRCPPHGYRTVVTPCVAQPKPPERTGSRGRDECPTASACSYACPSCHAKGLVAWSGWLEEDGLRPYPDANPYARCRKGRVRPWRRRRLVRDLAHLVTARITAVIRARSARRTRRGHHALDPVRRFAAEWAATRPRPADRRLSARQAVFRHAHLWHGGAERGWCSSLSWTACCIPPTTRLDRRSHSSRT